MRKKPEEATPPNFPAAPTAIAKTRPVIESTTTQGALEADALRPERQMGNKRGPILARADLILLGALIVIVALVYETYALRVGNFQDDEELYMTLARYIARHFPGALLQGGIYPRGSQRLDQILLALPFLFWRGPSVFAIAHAIQALLFTSTALPVFLLARQSGLERAAALFAATLSIVVPWAVVSTSFLAESAAYPAFAWVLYATWLAARRPSYMHDGLVLLALAVAALSRTALLALAPLPVLAIVWHEWSWEMRHLKRAHRARGLPRRLWTRHPVLTTTTGVATVTVIVWRLGLLPGQGLATLTGDYGLPHVGALTELWARYRQYISRMTVGTGFLAVVVAVPWLLATCIRPRSGGNQALAVVCTLGLATILLSLLQAAPDERYVLYGAVPVALAAAASLSAWSRAPHRGALAVGGVFIGAAVVIALVSSVSWPGLASSYDFFSFPTAIFFQRVLLGHTSLLHLPLLSPVSRVCAAVLLLSAAFALLGRSRRAARPAAVLLGVGLIALCSTQTLYSLRKFTETAGEASGPDAAARSWVDRVVPSDAQVGELAVSMGATSAYLPIWRATDFWNASIGVGAFLSAPGTLPLPLGIEPRPVSVQAGTGLLSASNFVHRIASPELVPRYLLLPRQGTNAIGLDAQVVAQDPYLPLELVKLAQPARAEWSLAGTSPEGFFTPGTNAVATVYGGALSRPGAHCAKFSLLAPPSFTGRWPYRVMSAGHLLAHGSLTAEQTVTVSTPLSPTVGSRGSTSFAVEVKGGQVTIEGATIATRLAFFAVGPCRTSHIKSS